MSILAWRDALAVRCISRLFPADKRGDWPDCLTPGQAAALQRPYVGDDTQGRRQMNALASVIKEACLSGALPCDEEVKVISPPAPPVQEKNYFAKTFASAEWLSEFSPQSIASPQLNKKKEHREYFIKPVDLLAWFNSCELVPTQHLAAWFKAQGVALATESSSAPETPAIKKGDVTDWPSLVRYRQQFVKLDAQKRPGWPVEHIVILGAALKAERASHSKGATKRVASELGTSGQRVTELLKREDYKDWLKSPASPFNLLRRSAGCNPKSA